MLLNKKMPFFFIFFFLIKIRLEIRFNNILKRKQTLFDHKNKIFHSPKNRIFPKGLTDAFGQKMPIFSLFVFATDINIIKENKGRCKESTIRGHRKNLSPRWDSNPRPSVF